MQKYKPSPVEFAKLALTAAITTSAGGLVALLSFVASAEVGNDGKWPLFIAMTLLGLALLMFLWSTVFAYLSEFSIEMGWRNKRHWWLGFLMAILGLSATTLGFVFAGWALAIHIW